MCLTVTGIVRSDVSIEKTRQRILREKAEMEARTGIPATWRDCPSYNRLAKQIAWWNILRQMDGKRAVTPAALMKMGVHYNDERKEDG